ncbi:uncharacterized protein N7484_004598 [Penicillium longicatenatum]|uniref:uncharacterized protein n=1 Tax=Penicillium longicatenatum TaxID=1561947 RepID=UPI002547B5B1|nr:uncharacterized protein N7484_004598 [Penicillium longicatenatum]KAJ5650875.1 hypothetical protein N7484_004598 [Penicillium longicatenatum]
MKGFIGGIPLALLVAAVQVQAMEQGAVSTDDEDGTFTSPYSADVHTHTNVNEHYKDNHSIKIKDKNIYPPPSFGHGGPGPALGPGAGPFGHADGPGAGPFNKRSWPSGGTAEGGPSGNDEGQTFNMPITGIFHTDVNEYSKDDHSVHVKNKDIHPGPVIEAAPFHPPPQFAGPPNGPGGHAPYRKASGESSDKFEVSADGFTKRFSPGGTAMGGPGGGESHGPKGEEGYPVIAGGTAMGGPSGDDEGINWDISQTADIKTNVNEDYEDDHSINIKHKDVFPPPSHPPFGFPKRGLYPHSGGTVIGGPSGDDGGQSFNMPITVETDTAVNEHYQDDHSIDLKHEDVYPAPHFGHPFRRAYSPDSADREGGDDDDYSPPIVSGGTAMGGPSGDDDGINWGSPTHIGVDTNVNEHHDDNHAVKIDTTTVHPSSWDFHPAPAPAPAPVHEVHEVHEVPAQTVHEEVPQMPWMTYTDQQHAAGVPAEIHTTPAAPEHHEIPAPSEPAPPSHRAEEEHVPECSAQVHEVVHTVTETQYKQVQATETVYQQVPVVSQVVQTSAVPMHAVPMESGSDPKIMSFSAPARSSSSNVPYASYPYSAAKSSMSAPAAMYSQIPVHVPMATPSSSASMMPMVTPASSHGLNMPTGVSPEQSAFASSSAHASPSKGVMFTGAASRVSGGIVSAAAAVAGVLAFIL